MALPVFSFGCKFRNGFWNSSIPHLHSFVEAFMCAFPLEGACAGRGGFRPPSGTICAPGQPPSPARRRPGFSEFLIQKKHGPCWIFSMLWYCAIHWIRPWLGVWTRRGQSKLSTPRHLVFLGEWGIPIILPHTRGELCCANPTLFLFLKKQLFFLLKEWVF